MVSFTYTNVLVIGLSKQPLKKSRFLHEGLKKMYKSLENSCTASYNVLQELKITLFKWLAFIHFVD